MPFGIEFSPALGVFRVEVSVVIQPLFRDAIQILNLGVRNVGKSKRP
jgi:hypothetical protein